MSSVHTLVKLTVHTLVKPMSKLVTLQASL